MPWTCRLREFTLDDHGQSFAVGDMFYLPRHLYDHPDDPVYWLRHWERHLSDYYRQHNSHRAPIMVCLPGNCLWCVDSQTVDNGQWSGASGWTVTGEAPFITVAPSINIGGTYHGYLQNGVISDDVDGRSYTEDGKRQRTS